MEKLHAGALVEPYILFWVMAKTGAIFKTDSFCSAVQHAVDHPYALCDHNISRDGKLNLCGNVWAIGNNVREIFVNMTGCNSSDNELVISEFINQCGFAYWILLPALDELHYKFNKRESSMIAYVTINGHATSYN